MDPFSEITSTAWEALEGRLAGTIVEGVRGLIDGAEEDLRTFGLNIAMDLTRAVRRKDTAWEAELMAQLPLLLEISRLRAVNAKHAMLMQVIHAMVRMALEVAGTLLQGFVRDQFGGLFPGKA